MSDRYEKLEQRVERLETMVEGFIGGFERAALARLGVEDASRLQRLMNNPCPSKEERQQMVDILQHAQNAHNYN